MAELTPTTANDPADMSLMEHLKELRKRLFYAVIFIVAGAIASFAYAQQIFEVLTAPYFLYFPANSLIGTGPAEPFILKIKVSFFAGMFLTSPMVFYQLWLFIAPGLHDNERKMVMPFVFTTTLLFIGGAYICYVMLLPASFAFFKDQYDSVGLTPQIRISENLALILHALFGMGAVFEIPVLVYFLARFGFITHKTLIGGIRYAVVGVFVLSAIITPTPDIMNQILFSGPLLILYVVSIGVAWFASRNYVEPPPSSSQSTPTGGINA